MKDELNIRGALRLFVRILVPFAMVSSLSPVLAQTGESDQFRSRSEYRAYHRKVEQAFPELVRAMRTLHLSPEKTAEIKAKLRGSEAATRATRQELQSLEENNKQQGYGRESKSARADELRALLKQSTDQLHSELKALLTPQQRDQLERRLQKQNSHGSRKQKSSSHR